MTNTTTLADIVRTRVSAMRKEAAVAEAVQRSQARRSALTKPAESGGTALQKQAQKLKLLAGAARAAGVRKTLAAGKVVLPSAKSLKELILDRVAGLRGQRSLGWPLPAYPGRAGRAKGLLDYEDRLWRTGDWSRKLRDGETLGLYEARLLRQLNGDRGAVGRQLSDALHAAERKHKPVDIDLAPLVAKKKAEEAAYAEGFCKAAEVAGVDPVALCKKAQALKVYSRLGALLSRARVGAQKGGKRYLELLRGGRPRFIEQMRQGFGVERLGGPLESTKPLERLLGRLRAGRSRIASRVSRIKGGPLENPADVTEARKALAVQLGTGAGVAGAGTGLYGLLSGNEGD